MTESPSESSAGESPTDYGHSVRVVGGGDGRQESSSSSNFGGAGASVGAMLVEGSPNDYFWGCGYHGSGTNHLGRLLMKVRGALLLEAAQDGSTQEE